MAIRGASHLVQMQMRRRPDQHGGKEGPCFKATARRRVYIALAPVSLFDKHSLRRVDAVDEVVDEGDGDGAERGAAGQIAMTAPRLMPD